MNQANLNMEVYTYIFCKLIKLQKKNLRLLILYNEYPARRTK